MILTDENYYSQEANMEYMSVSQYKMFCGSLGMRGCEYQALETLNGDWQREQSDALLVGSYVDAYFEGSLDTFKREHPELYKGDGTLYAKYAVADRCIERCERDPLFMKFMSGQKQVIMTGELFGTKWKIKMDSYHPNVCIVDLKTMASIRKQEWTPDFGKLEFVRYWGYDIQGAIYQEIVRQNTGKKLPFYIAAVSKEKEPDIEVIQVTDNFLRDALSIVESNMPRVLDVKFGHVEPIRCDTCDCCKHNRILLSPISLLDLTEPLFEKGSR